MTAQQVVVLDRDSSVGAWLLHQLEEISIPARWVAAAGDLIDLAEMQPPTVCLVALRAPVAQMLNLIANLSQEPRFASTAFILMGPAQYKHAAFEAGADDYLTTPPDVIELRKRVRLYLDRASLEERAANVPEAVDVRLHPSWELMARYTDAALALLHPDGSLIQANPAREALAEGGVDAAWSLVGEATLADAIHQGAAWKGYMRGVRPDGTPWLRQVTLTPLHGTGGQLTGFVVTQIDLGTAVVPPRTPEA